MAEDLVKHLTARDLIALHDEAMTATGCPPEWCDEAKLAGAAVRPQSAEYHEQADLIRQAAILTVSICKARAFVDGNKRTALAALDAFLYINGRKYLGPALERAHRLEAIAAFEATTDAITKDFEAWLRPWIGPR